MKPHKRLLTAALLFIVLLTGAALWLVQLNAPATAASHLQRGGTLRVGFALEPPYAYFDAQGQVTGEAAEIFKLMANQMGVEHIDWVRLDFAHLLHELQLGRIDAIAAGMFVTPERQREAAFTRPTARVRPALVVRKGETAIPLEPLLAKLSAHPPLRWTTIHGAAENGLLFQAGIAPEQVDTVPQAHRGLRAVAESSADAFAISAVTAWYLVAHNTQWALEVRTLSDGPAGLPAFAFRLDDARLRDQMNQQLQTFLGSDEHRELVQAFGFTSDEMPPEAP